LEEKEKKKGRQSWEKKLSAFKSLMSVQNTTFKYEKYEKNTKKYKKNGG